MAAHRNHDRMHGGPPAATAAMNTRQAIVDALERDADAVVSDALDRISILPPYHAMSSAMRDEVAATVGWILRTFASCLRTSRLLSQQEVAELRNFGMQRAQVGIPLTALTNAFEVAFEVSQSALIRSATRADLPITAILPGLTAQLFPLSRQAIDAIEAGHGAPPASHPDQILLQRASLAEDILASALPVAEIAERAARVGLAVGPSPALIVAIPTERTPLPALGDAILELTGAVPNTLAALVRKTPSAHAVVASLAPMPAGTQRLLSKVSDRHHLTLVHASGSGVTPPMPADEARGRNLSDPHDLDVLRRALYLAPLHGTTDYT